MRTSNSLIAAGVAFVLGIAVTWFATRHKEQAGIAAPAHSDKKVLYWYDPMVPQQHFDAPGKSPLMDMQLLPKYAEDSDDQGGVRVDPRLVQNLGIRTAKAELGTLIRTVRATGSVAFDERAVTVVQSRVAGIVERLLVRAPLTTVESGQPLLTLIAPDWTAAQEEYLSLRSAKAPGLEALRAAARQRLQLIGMDETQIRAVERGGEAATRITIRAPRGGVITELSVREGASVAAGTPLMALSGLDEVWMNAAIPEVDSGRIAPGAHAVAVLPAFPGETFEGTVEALLPELDPTTRTQNARIVLSNPRHRLAPGMYARVEIAVPPQAEAVLVPSEAVIATGTRSVVIIAEGQGRFRAQEVRTGEQANGRIAVLAGLQQSDTVVLSGQFLIDSEATLAGALTRLNVSAPSAPNSAAEEAARTEQYSATGTIERIEGDTWTIATDASPSLGMGAMTMSFPAPSKASANPVRSGQRISFSFIRSAAGKFEITQVAVLDAKGKLP